MYYRHWLNKWRKRKKEHPTLPKACIEMLVDMILQNHIQITPIVWRSRRSAENVHAWKSLKVKASGEWYEERERNKSIEINTQLFVIAFKSEINFRYYLFIIFLFHYFSCFQQFSNPSLIYTFLTFISNFLFSYLFSLRELNYTCLYQHFILSCSLVPYFYWKTFWTVENNRMKAHCFLFVISSPMRFL